MLMNWDKIDARIAAAGGIATVRTDLLQLLQRDAILHASEEQAVVSRDGTAAAWMFESWPVSLTARGSYLAGLALLDRVRAFDGRQLATYGLTGVPLLQSCIILSDGMFNGLVVRKERKAHGSQKLIEGSVNIDEPVVLIDDSISSGSSAFEGTLRLEQAGLRVLGGVCLVRFGWLGGFSKLRALGYQLDYVFDIWEDFIYTTPPGNPGKLLPDLTWSDQPAPEGLHPAALARLAARAFIAGQPLPLPPQTLDRPYDSGGGTFVSFSYPSDLDNWLSRDGFWHFPGEAGSLAQDTILATVKAVMAMPTDNRTVADLDKLSIAVTYCSRLTPVTVSELDNSRFGIVVRSRERRGWIGGALPNLPGIDGNWEQFLHAHTCNAQLFPHEPYDLFRHDITRCSEPAGNWAPCGAPMSAAPQPLRDLAAQLAARARDMVVSHVTGRGEVTAPVTAPAGVAVPEYLFVEVYIQGRLRGCNGLAPSDLDNDLRRAAMVALHDQRFPAVAADIEGQLVSITVSLLHNGLDLGLCPLEEVGDRFTRGQHGLMVRQGSQNAIFLPHVLCHSNWSKEQYARELARNADIQHPPYYWRRFDCETWLAADNHSLPLAAGWPQRLAPADPAAELPASADMLAAYLRRNQCENGGFFATYDARSHCLTGLLDPACAAHCAWVLARHGQMTGSAESLAAARRARAPFLDALTPGDGDAGIASANPEGPPSIAELSFILLSLTCDMGEQSEAGVSGRLARTLWRQIDRHGRLQTHLDPAQATSDDQDDFPGAALLALAADHAAGGAADLEGVDRAFRFYRHRFRNSHQWGLVSWQLQAWSAWAVLLNNDEYAGLVHEIAGWCLGFQERSSGGFINARQAHSPGYTTGLYLEGIAAAARMAQARGEQERAVAYIQSCAGGFRFLDRITLHGEDLLLTPAPAFAQGGVRASLTLSEIRLDFVQHALNALLTMGRVFSTNEGSDRTNRWTPA